MRLLTFRFTHTQTSALYHVIVPVNRNTNVCTTRSCSRAAKIIHCAQNVKTVRFCTEFNKSINNIFLICHILWHFQNGCHWPWEFHMGQKLKHAPIFLKIVSNCLSCPKDSKMYSLMHLQCLVFELHKNIGQRSFQICTGGQNLNLLRFYWNIPQIVCINT